MERPQDVTFQRPKDVGRGRPQAVARGRPLALHRGPYGDVHRTSFGDVLWPSLGRNFAEWVNGCFKEIRGNKYLKELRNYNRKLFLRPPQKIGGNTTKILNYHFSK